MSEAGHIVKSRAHCQKQGTLSGAGHIVREDVVEALSDTLSKVSISFIEVRSIGNSKDMIILSTMIEYAQIECLGLGLKINFVDLFSLTFHLYVIPKLVVYTRNN